MTMFVTSLALWPLKPPSKIWKLSAPQEISLNEHNKTPLRHVVVREVVGNNVTTSTFFGSLIGGKDLSFDEWIKKIHKIFDFCVHSCMIPMRTWLEKTLQG